MIAGIRSDVGVKIFGDDFDILRGKAEEVERILKSVPGTADVVTEQVTGLPILQIQVSRLRSWAAADRHLTIRVVT